MADSPRIPCYSVSGITAIIKDRLDDIRRMTVEGEVSNFRAPSASGHLYFTLSDDKAKLNASFFSFRQQEQIRQSGALPVLENGGRVRVTGKIALYAPHGSYYFNVERLERCDGVGDLLLRFEELKRRLFAEGLCDATRKRPIPRIPRRIGIVTAPTGAAIRDILSILRRRFPNLHIIIAPCRVQGAEAPAEIAQAIHLLNQHFGPDSAEPLDAMIVGRGGGSLEDLWAFNEEVVARAVASSAIPVISAVGHEPDYAITDFVADLRAATPSAAAELLCGRKDDVVHALETSRTRLLNALRQAYRKSADALRRHRSSALFRDPVYVLETSARRVDMLCVRMNRALEGAVSNARQRLARQTLALQQHGLDALPRATQTLQSRASRLAFAVQQALNARKATLQARAATLMAYDPYAVLKRGYAMVTTSSGLPLTDSAEVSVGAQLGVRLARGRLSVSVVDSDQSHQAKDSKQ